jgi:hypothetical protein
MFEQPIFIFSEYCQHSINFINVLRKHPDFINQFKLINIDVDPQTKQRPRVFYDIQAQLNHVISEVPTVIIKGGEYVLTGEEAFKWLEYELKQNQAPDLMAFNPNEMGSFSDSYSKFGATDLHDATEQTFKFVHRPDDKINTPQEDSTVSADEYNQKQKERDNFKFNSQPQYGNAPQTFSNSNFSGKTNSQQWNQQGNRESKGSLKQREIDVRLQQLLSQREEFMPTLPKGRSVDFKTGHMQ